ncbi:MAG: hypothetical protein U0L91_07325 [Gemmiger sp.]|uniref:hypothetical protein n=1 Tax=Gemmiger sp. TaxID=2049027 RepID=UPI002E7691B0|nr:hypothetical protein [Gemmiger sp.]MEE0801074.1 hypothetical protein [Gemmiger sp.]
MSTPHYDWWSYAKGMVRRFPELRARAGAGQTLAAVNRRELQAVEQAVAVTRAMDTGEERLRLIRLTYWNRNNRYTLEGAAGQVYISYITAKRWHRDFIYRVAEAYGLLEA